MAHIGVKNSNDQVSHKRTHIEVSHFVCKIIQNVAMMCVCLSPGGSLEFGTPYIERFTSNLKCMASWDFVWNQYLLPKGHSYPDLARAYHAFSSSYNRVLNLGFVNGSPDRTGADMYVGPDTHGYNIKRIPSLRYCICLQWIMVSAHWTEWQLKCI